MAKFTDNPCPGCGERKSYRKVDQLCRECQALIDFARRVHSLGCYDQETIVVRMGERSHWNEYIHTGARNSGHVIRELFHRLAGSVASPAPSESAEFDLLGKIEGSGITVTIPKAVATAIRDLRQAVVTALKDEYEAGKRDGDNLLMRLATGDLAPNEYFERQNQKK